MDGKDFLRKMQTGDVMVWDEVMPMLRRIALGACRDLRVYDTLKEDIVQEVALRVFTQWQSYTGQSTLSTWIYAIARNRCLDELRKRVVRGEQHHSSNNSDESTPPPAGSYDAKFELMLCVQQLLAELDAQPAARKNSHRISDVLKYWIESSPTMEELADYLNTSVTAAKQRMYEIRKRMEELCRKYCGHDDCSLQTTGSVV